MSHSLSARWAFVVAFAAAAPCMSQLVPERAYYGVGRAVPMTVALPEGVEGEARIEMYVPGATEPAMVAPVVKGAVDVASLFPDLWEKKSPQVMYAQLAVGKEKVGAPVVIRPTVGQPLAYTVRRDPAPPEVRWMQIEGKYSGIHAYVDKQVVFETDVGDITFQLRPDKAPNTCVNFLALAHGGFYTDILFHRIMGPQQGRPGFMAQVGDPTGTGEGGPGYFIDLEPSNLPHDFGVLSMARSGDPNTNGSQVFICFSREGTQGLDGGYCAFAQAVGGAEAIEKLEAVPTTDIPTPRGPEKSKPVTPVKLKRARLVDAPPFGSPGREPVKRTPAPAPAR